MQINDNAQRILVFGDSFTFGKVPGGNRFPVSQRYTGVLQQALGSEYEVIEEGLRGRVISGENPFFPHRNGAEQFGPIFASHVPLDLVILMLGTNDTNSGSTKSVEEVIAGFAQYKQQMTFWCEHLGFEMPEVLLVSPPIVDEQNSYKAFNEIFTGSEEKSKLLASFMSSFAENNGWKFFDSSKVVTASEIDGVHLDEENNRKLGEQLAAVVTERTS